MTEMHLYDNFRFKAGLTFFFDDELKGLLVRTRMFDSTDTDSTKYGNWTFPTIESFDATENDQNFSFILYGPDIVIGESNLKPT